MEHNGGELDEREIRAAQGAIAVLLFGAFVFQLPELVYGVTVIVAVSAAFGPRANAFASAFRMLVTPRLRPPLEVVTVASARALDTAEAGLLVVASLAFFADIDIVGVFLALGDRRRRDRARNHGVQRRDRGPSSG